MADLTDAQTVFIFGPAKRAGIEAFSRFEQQEREHPTSAGSMDYFLAGWVRAVIWLLENPPGDNLLNDAIDLAASLGAPPFVSPDPEFPRWTPFDVDPDTGAPYGSLDPEQV